MDTLDHLDRHRHLVALLEKDCRAGYPIQAQVAESQVLPLPLVVEIASNRLERIPRYMK